MSANAKVVDAVKGNATLVRPRFSPGLLLRDDDLTQGVEYTRDLSRLLFRSLFGCGVVCGLEVKKPVISCGKLIVTVSSGVALDCRGDPIHVPTPQSISIDPSCGKKIPPKMCVLLKRAEKCCAPRSAACSCDEEDVSTVCTRERDCFEIRIAEECPHDCVCGCPEPEVAKPESKPEPVSEPELILNKRSAAARAAQNVRKAKEQASENLYSVSQASSTSNGAAQQDCWCADPTSKCYRDHYCGKCACECCDCEWVVLALVTNDESVENGWKVDHRVRRFVRPVLMRDPIAWKEQHDDFTGCDNG